MNEELVFLNFDDIDDDHEREILKNLIDPSVRNPDVQFPWDAHVAKANSCPKTSGSLLNVYAPSFRSAIVSNPCEQSICVPAGSGAYLNNYQNCIYLQANAPLHHLAQQPGLVGVPYPAQAIPNGIPRPIIRPDVNGGTTPYIQHQNINHNEVHVVNVPHPYKELPPENIPFVPSTGANAAFGPNIVHTAAASFPNSGVPPPSTFKLSPTVSSFVPQNPPPPVVTHATTPAVESDHNASSIAASQPDQLEITEKPPSQESSSRLDNLKEEEDNSYPTPETGAAKNDASDGSWSEEGKQDKSAAGNSVATPEKEECEDVQKSKKEENASQVAAKPVSRTFADVVKNRAENRTSSAVPVSKPTVITSQLPLSKPKEQVTDGSGSISDEKRASIKQDKSAIQLGRYLYEMKIDFTPVSLQPRGLINRRNWCYINATLQALLACCPFYSLLRNLPIGPGVDRGKSSTPVIDSMVSLTYEFVKYSEAQEELQTGAPFQPNTIYEILGNLKSDCLKGQQEDAEEFLSYILNAMHEEMVAIIKNYEEKLNINPNRNEEMKQNGHIDASDGEEEWQVIGAKQKGMVTRKVVEHKTPISDLLGGQIKSFLSTVGSKTSASVQPFFTLQLDIQSDNVTSVEEALSQMAAKEPIHGYTCAKTKREVEAYSQVMLQKLPPILILHLKRFVYNINGGGCKKVMKHTEYPMSLELKKELFSPEARRMKRHSTYKLFAVVYHDGEEAIKGHYISDIYHHGTKGWIRCDDRSVSSIAEAEVLSHSPPRVPYLLFYQVCNEVRSSAT